MKEMKLIQFCNGKEMAMRNTSLNGDGVVERG